MGALRKSLWTIVAMTALPASAAAEETAPDVCGALARLIASANERPAFRSVERRLAAGEEVVPGFAAGRCRVTADEGVTCRYSWTRIHRAGNVRIEHGMTCLPCAGPAPSHFTIGYFERPRGRRP